MDRVAMDLPGIDPTQLTPIDVDALAEELQTKGADAFVTSWNELLAVIDRASPAVA